MVSPAVGLTYSPTAPFAQMDVGVGFSSGLEEAQREVRVGGGEKAGDARGVVEAVCEGRGGEDGAGGAGGEEGGGD